jgi:hypothetical protein
MRFDRQLDASHGNGFGLFSWLLRQRHLPPVAASCSHGLHKGSIQLVPIYLDDGQPSRFTVPVQLPREAIANIERR